MKAIFVSAVLFLCLPLMAFAGGLFEISEPKFGCSYAFIQEKDIITDCETPSGGTLSRSSLDKYVFAVVSIIGGKPALEYLDENDHLPLNVTFWLDDERIDTVDYGIKPKQWIKHESAIRFEQINEGYFTWRIPIFSQKIWGKKLELVFEDHTNARLSPIGIPGNYTARINFTN